MDGDKIYLFQKRGRNVRKKKEKSGKSKKISEIKKSGWGKNIRIPVEY